ncbi:U3 snoRNP protein, partial [Cladochytrium tenue]
MAENVHFQLERMLPELASLEKEHILQKKEIEAIVKRRTELEYSVHRRISRLPDYLRYIEYETNLDRLCRKRIERLRPAKPGEFPLPVPGMRGHSVYENAADGEEDAHKRAIRAQKLRIESIKAASEVRIRSLYTRALRTFPADLPLWFQYFDWCRSVRNNRFLSGAFARGIEAHPTKPAIWIMAAKWEYEGNKSVRAARILMQRGLRLNNDSREMWLEYFRLELHWIYKLQRERRALFGPIEERRKKAAAAAATALSLEALSTATTEDDEGPQDPTSIPEMGVERGLPRSRLETDPVLAASLDRDAAQSSLGLPADGSEPVSVFERVLQESLIPRAVYRNAIH